MNLDYSSNGKLKIEMKYYIYNMIEEFPERIKPQKIVPSNDKLFKVSESVKKLNDERKATFHTFVMKSMFL